MDPLQQHVLKLLEPQFDDHGKYSLRLLACTYTRTNLARKAKVKLTHVNSEYLILDQAHRRPRCGSSSSLHHVHQYLRREEQNRQTQGRRAGPQVIERAGGCDMPESQ